MADDQPDQSEKTEEPTSKRLEDAHKKGDVVKSQEVSTWFVMLAATLAAVIFSQSMATTIASNLKIFLIAPHDIAIDGQHLIVLWRKVGWGLVLALALPLGLLMVGGIVGNLVQHMPVFSAEQMKPKFSKISPFAGAKRLFSITSLVNFAKGISKLVIVGTVMFLIVWPERDRLDVLITSDVSVLLVIIKNMGIKLLISVVAVLSVIAVADYLYQRHKWNEKQKMTMKELRDEYKQMEGDPTVKAKLRQIRSERGRKRMMSDVPRAAVVITNPTHYAVALEYNEEMGAPICVAKGKDQVALNIREIAKEHDIPIVENPPLARALHATIELDDEVPEEHYQAVAQVIGYVMRIKSKVGRN